MLGVFDGEVLILNVEELLVDVQQNLRRCEVGGESGQVVAVDAADLLL